MRWLNRLTDILSANLSDLIERYEDPELLLKQAVREMDESIRAALQDAVKVVAHEKILARQLADEESAVTLSRRQAEAAVQRTSRQHCSSTCCSAARWPWRSAWRLAPTVAAQSGFGRLRR
ncbi:MAG TPA: PspA/IM30 family protein [Pirellulales bacterium]|nr:PspA/IM30 family protein [Pirellulales bacterium]